MINNSSRCGCGHETVKARPRDADTDVELVQGSHAAFECLPAGTTGIRHFIVSPAAPISRARFLCVTPTPSKKASK